MWPYPGIDLFLHQSGDCLPQFCSDVRVHAVKQSLSQSPHVGGQVLEQLVNGLKEVRLQMRKKNHSEQRHIQVTLTIFQSSRDG